MWLNLADVEGLDWVALLHGIALAGLDFLMWIEFILNPIVFILGLKLRGNSYPRDLLFMLMGEIGKASRNTQCLFQLRVRIGKLSPLLHFFWQIGVSRPSPKSR